MKTDQNINGRKLTAVANHNSETSPEKNNIFTKNFIEAGFKLSERDRLRSRFIMAEAQPPANPARMRAAENFLAELLADPEKAESAASFFPTILGIDPPAAVEPSVEPVRPDILPWLYNPPTAELHPDSFSGDAAEDEKKLLLDYQGRIAALMSGVAVAGAAPLTEPFIYTQSWDGRSIEFTDSEKPEITEAGIGIPKKADKVLVLGFVRASAIMGMNPGLSRLRPDTSWLEWPEQVQAVLKMADFIAAQGFIALASAGGILMADHYGALAGLGELGRQGLLITPEYGPNLRLFTIITDYPFETEKPLIFGVGDYCETCQRCINECPARAISEGHRKPGLFQWPVNRRACFDNWLEKRDPCRKCIEICPYTREPLVGSPGGRKPEPSA